MDSNHSMNSTDDEQASCNMYIYVMQGIVGGVLSVIGIVCNIGSFVVFRHHVIKTPTTNQLQWLALVDTILLILYFVYVILSFMGDYLSTDEQVIYSNITVYIWPVWRIARSSTNWLTLFIGGYRYLAICKPVSNSYLHVERHRRKYVVMVFIVAILCNIPYFFVLDLSLDVNKNVEYAPIVFIKDDLFRWVYHSIIYIAITVCLPVIILLIVTIKLMMVLTKMHNSNMSNLDINTVLITILLTFTICHFPLLVCSILHFIHDLAGSKSSGCGSLYFYFSRLVPVFLALNSAANPFIYMVFKDHFTWPLRHTLRNERAESIEMGSI